MVACGERGEAQDDARIHEIAMQLIPHIERVVGLSFRAPPTIAVRDAEQVRAYLVHKLYEEYPAEAFDGMTEAYRLFGLIPDTLDLRELLLALYTEQVVGYYDPDSAALYVVQGTPSAQLTVTLVHELVHALQGQYVPLDSLLSLERQNDRRMAAQAVMEGQAMLSSLLALNPSVDLAAVPELWRDIRDRIRAQQERMPIFSGAPLIVREALVFPYLAGMDFVRWFRAQRDTVPFGARLPISTEQILHPERYASGDVPADLAFPPAPTPVYDDNLGEFEIRILLTQLTGTEAAGVRGPLEWAGDRYAVYRAPDGSGALVWWTLWDTERAAARMERVLAKAWPPAPAGSAGRRHLVDRRRVDGRPALLLVDAPGAWDGWAAIPAVTVVER